LNFFFFFLPPTAFAEGTKEQTERYAPLSGRASKGVGVNGSNGVDGSSDHSAKRPRKPSRGDDDDDESTVASTGVKFSKEKKIEEEKN
jgi:hypothetical protein